MDEQRIPELIDKYIAGTATDQERAELLNWYRSVEHEEVHWPEEEAVFEERIARVFSQIQRSTNQTVHDEVKETPIKRIFPWRLITIAAVMLMVVGVATILLQDRTVEELELVSQDEKIKPGGNKAVLTLANGQTITLGDSVATFEIADQGIFRDENGELLFQPDAGAMTALVYNELTTPKGGQYTITLPDGTKVFLNCESSLAFPTSFVGAERKVMLEGEAYFEVAENKERPFIVSMQGLDVEVLGTTFNVKGYQNEAHIATTLVEGSVRIRSEKSETMLKPGQSAILDKVKGTLRTELANIATEIAWKEGYFVFEDENIKEIMSQLSRWYDIDALYQGSMDDKIYSGRILRRSEITEVLDMLEQTGTIKFQIEGRRVVVMP